MTAEYREQELKFDADATFALPDLSVLLPDGGSLRDGLIRLESIYYDTDEFDLQAQGVTLRQRLGDADTGWHLKIPDGDARTELRLDPADELPAELLALSTGFRRGRPLRRVASLRTERHTVELLDADGAVLVEVADDAVTSAAGGAEGGTLDQWREIEAELGPAGTSKFLRKVDKHLQDAGAAPSTSANKLARALNLPDPNGAPRKGAATLLTSYIAAQDDAIVAGDLGLRRRQDGSVHATRVGIRRLRSTLKVYAKFFDAERAAQLDHELRLYAQILGEVRDREVQRVRLAAALAALPEEDVLGPVAATIDGHLHSEQLRHEKIVAQAMSTQRYADMLQELQRWRTDPPLTVWAELKPKVLRRALASAIKKVDKQLKAGLGPKGNDEQLHKARKSIKRARYAAELAEPELGRKKAKKVVSKYKDLQEHLGDHQDSTVAAELLRQLGATAGVRGGENGFTYGILYARELAIAQASRQALRAT